MNTRNSLVPTLSLMLALTLLMCSGLAAAGTPDRSAGCKTEHFLITHLSAPYQAATGQKIIPGSTGNKKAIMLLADGKLDFAYTCKTHEKLAKKFGIDGATSANWVSTVIARDPIVVVANPTAGISNLTMDQLNAVFSGNVANWSEVGGADQAVTTAYLAKSVESGVVTVFKETTIGKKGNLDPKAKTLPGPGPLGNYTKVSAGAVTFMALNSYKPEYGQIVSINGVAPQKKFIVEGAYPLAVTYHIVYDQTNGEAAKSFLQFLGKPAGQALIDEVMVAVPLTGALIQ